MIVKFIDNDIIKEYDIKRKSIDLLERFSYSGFVTYTRTATIYNKKNTRVLIEVFSERFEHKIYSVSLYDNNENMLSLYYTDVVAIDFFGKDKYIICD